MSNTKGHSFLNTAHLHVLICVLRRFCRTYSSEETFKHLTVKDLWDFLFCMLNQNPGLQDLWLVRSPWGQLSVFRFSKLVHLFQVKPQRKPWSYFTDHISCFIGQASGPLSMVHGLRSMALVCDLCSWFWRFGATFDMFRYVFVGASPLGGLALLQRISTLADNMLMVMTRDRPTYSSTPVVVNVGLDTEINFSWQMWTHLCLQRDGDLLTALWFQERLQVGESSLV